MGLTIYETELDRVRERAFMEKVGKRFKCDCHKLPYEWEFDMLLSREGSLVALGEMKQRQCRSDKFDTVVMGESKLRKALYYSERFLRLDGKGRPPVMLFVRYQDCDKTAKISSLAEFKRERFTANNHRDDPTDTEWVVHIPSSLFQTF